MNQTLLFDLDDTLIHCNKYFDMVLREFAEHMSAYYGQFGLSSQTFIEKQSELDTAGIAIHGFKADRFPASLVETYEFFAKKTGRRMADREKKQLYVLGNSVYEQNFEPYPHMEETLERLTQEGNSLCLYTGGDEVIQRTKVKLVGLERFFGPRIYVAQHKGYPFLSSLLEQSRLKPEETWMIGNSLRSDIKPALQAGIHAIFLPALSPWSYDEVELDLDPKGAYLTLYELKDVPEAIREFVQEQKAECKLPRKR